MKKFCFCSFIVLNLFVIFNFLTDRKVISSNAENIAIVIDGEDVSSFPSRDEGVVFEKVLCKNGSTGTWNNDTWNLSLVFTESDNCVVYFNSLYRESLLAKSDPVVNSGFIPVIIDSDGIIKKADIFDKWYSYEDKEWANAVTVNSQVYRDAEAGTIIPMDNIEEMYVWIPRYSYDADTIVDPSSAIDITFANTDTTAHPAFTVDGTEIKGIWVGKFEMGFKSGEDEKTVDVEYVVKPNLNSVHGTNILTFFNAISSMNTTNNLDEYSDVHMMKNIEWGSVAYLSQSIYGLCDSLTDCSKVENNNYYNDTNWDMVTGCGGSDANQISASSGVDICPVTNRWNTVNGTAASTTRNITGIYDMAGGRSEYVMGNMVDVDGLFLSSKSGFTTAPESKYLDVYENGTTTTGYSRGLIGDATRELNPDVSTSVSWNADSASMVNSTDSWFRRGGSSFGGGRAGIWTFNSANGNSSSYVSSRAAIWVY